MKFIKNKINTKMILVILFSVIILAITLTFISVTMIRSVFNQLYEEKLKTPGRVFSASYETADIVPYINKLKEQTDLLEKSREYISDRDAVSINSQDDEAKARMRAYRDEMDTLKDSKYFEIYQKILDLRTGTGLKYFRIIVDIDIPDTYFCVFDATYIAERGSLDGGDLGTPHLKANFPEIASVFSSGKDMIVLSPLAMQDQGTFYYGYIPITNIEGKVVAVIQTVINVQSLNQQLNSFVWLSILAVAVLSGIIILVTFLFLNGIIIKPVKRITKLSENISEGQMDIELPEEFRRKTDEIGTLGKSYESMRIVLQNMIAANNSIFESALAGKLNVRSDPALFKGLFAQVVSKINDTLDAVTFYLDSMPGAIAILNDDYEMVFANHLFKEFFIDVSCKEIYQKVLNSDIDDEDLLKKQLAAILSEREYSNLVWFDYGDERRCFSFICNQVRHANQASGAIIAVLDNTELVLSKDRALAASKAKSEFLSRVSHELRTPLNAIIGMSKLGLNDVDYQVSHERFEKIVSSSSHLSNIINDVLEMSRMESGKTEIRLAPTDLRKTVNECVEILIQRASEKNIELRYNFENTIPDVLIADEFRIKQVILNLLSNAVKFTNEGYVALDLKAEQKTDKIWNVTFITTDTGVGMSEAFLDKIFTPFEQEDSFFTRRYEGSGLGLSISHNLVELMGGELIVTSTLGAGSTFCFTLPLEVSTEAIKDEIDKTHKLEDDESLRGKRILLADDIDINRMIIVELLSKTDIIIEEVSDGEEAYQTFVNSEVGYYNLILMDIQMPKMDGYEATQAIRATKRSDSNIPIIAMTANALKEDIEQAYQMGMNDHIAKPIDFNDCLEKIKKYCK